MTVVPNLKSSQFLKACLHLFKVRRTEINLTLIFINEQLALVFCSSRQGQEMRHFLSVCVMGDLHQYLTVPCDVLGNYLRKNGRKIPISGFMRKNYFPGR